MMIMVNGGDKYGDVVRVGLLANGMWIMTVSDGGGGGSMGNECESTLMKSWVPDSKHDIVVLANPPNTLLTSTKLRGQSIHLHGHGLAFAFGE